MRVVALELKLVALWGDMECSYSQRLFEYLPFLSPKQPTSNAGLPKDAEVCFLLSIWSLKPIR
jgi:hypothetical protein